MEKNSENGVRDIREELICLLNFNIMFLSNKAVADLCSHEELFVKSYKDYFTSRIMKNHVYKKAKWQYYLKRYRNLFETL